MPTSDPVDSSSPASPRHRHVIDRALEYARLAAGGMTVSQIARHRRRSKAYASILLRLGNALRPLGPEELAIFRADRITWKLAQRIVRSGLDGEAIRRQLRSALGGFSSLTVDRRRHRARRPEQARRESGSFIWRWDDDWAARDPVGYVEAYRVHLLSLHRGVTARLREAASARAEVAPLPLAGQSLRLLTARVLDGRESRAAPGALRPSDRTAIDLLAALDPAVRAAE